MPEGDERPKVLARLAIVLCKAGDHRAEELLDLAGEATIVSQMLETAWRHDEALHELSAALARLEEYSLAEAVARHMDGARSRGSAFVTVARALKKSDATRANKLLDEAEALVNTPISKRQSQFLDDLSVVAGKDLVQPNLVKTRDGRLRALAADLTEAGEYDRARTIALRIVDPRPKAAALSHLASALAKAGEDRPAADLVVAEATAGVRKVEDPGADVRASRDVAEAYAREGKLREALTTLAMRSVTARPDSPPPLDDFVVTIAGWTEYLERVQRGLSVDVLKEALAVAAWIRPDWSRINQLVSGPAAKVP